MNENRSNRSRLTKQEIKSLYDQGLRVSEIATRAGVSGTAISSALKRLGVRLEKRARPGEERRVAVVKDYVSGLSYTQTARKNGCSVSAARRIVIASGVELRPSSEGRLRGSDHPQWRGGTTQTSDGYLATSTGRLHREVASASAGRGLMNWEDVHHIDGCKKNNDPSNLAIMPKREHQRFHTFLLHRDMKVCKETFLRICRDGKDGTWRFTKSDMGSAEVEFPLKSRSALSMRPRVCKVRGCESTRVGRGYCSKHYQRWRAVSRGHWVSSKGRVSACLRTTII